LTEIKKTNAAWDDFSCRKMFWHFSSHRLLTKNKWLIRYRKFVVTLSVLVLLPIHLSARPVPTFPGRGVDFERPQQIDLDHPGSVLWSHCSAIFANFRIFSPIFRGKSGVFLKNQCYGQFFQNSALFWVKNVIFSPIFWRKYLKNHKIGPRLPTNEPPCFPRLGGEVIAKAEKTC
jgi:hypothetical protein